MDLLGVNLVTTANVEGGKEAGLNEEEVGNVGDEAILQAEIENGLDLALRPSKEVKVKAKLVSKGNEVGNANENTLVDAKGQEVFNLLERSIITTTDMKGSKKTGLEPEEVGDVGNKAVLQAEIEDGLELALRESKESKVQVELIEKGNNVGNSNKDTSVDGEGQE